MALSNIPFYASLLGRPIDAKTKSTTTHVLVYGAIETHSKGKLGCIASNKVIADEVGLSERTVRDRIIELKKAGWIDYPKITGVELYNLCWK
jgi:DNA-binding transcriptional regulator PaaX